MSNCRFCLALAYISVSSKNESDCVLCVCRIVKLSSPNINNVLLFGCILTYSTVFMKTSDYNMSALCKVRNWGLL